MNPLLAFSIEPGWAALAVAGITAVTAVSFKFYGDARWERRDEAKEKVETLKNSDSQIQKTVDDLATQMKTQDESARVALAELRAEMTKGFANLATTVSAGVLSLTKEVAIIQGRLAGANGVSKSDA